MKILIAGDSHSNTQALMDIITKHPNMDLYLHTGDSEDTSFSIYPFESVRGNCDYDDYLANKIKYDTPYGALLMQHKPNISILELKKQKIKIFVYGHLHKRDFHQEDGIYFVSPGSIAFSRDQYSEGYVILDITKEDVKATFFDL